jgi:hypothetical protein
MVQDQHRAEMLVKAKAELRRVETHGEKGKKKVQVRDLPHATFFCEL